MAEYAGFQEREGTDFAGSINDLATKVSGLESKVKEVRASDKKLLTDNDALLDAHKPFAYQDANDYVAASVPSIRAYQYDMYKKLNNREITPVEFRTAMQNQTTDWNNKIGLLKGFDEMTLEAQKRLEPGPNGEPPIGSTKDTKMFENRMKFYTDLKTKKMFISSNGKLADASVDENGKIVEGSIFDMKAQMNINNIASNRFSLRNALEKDTKVLGAYSKFEAFKDGSTELIEATKNSPEFIAAKTDIIGQYISNDETVGHILTDNSNEGYLVWSFEDEKEKLITDKINATRLINGTVDEAAVRKQMEAKMLHLKSDDNGVWSYQITPEMRKVASDIVEKQLLSQLGYTEKGTAMKNMSSGDKSLTPAQAAAAEEKRNANKYVYQSSANAFLDTPRYDGLDTDNYSFKTYTAPDGFRHVIATPYMSLKGVKSPDTTRAVDIVDPKMMTAYVKNKTGTTKYSGMNYDEGRRIWVKKEGNAPVYNFPEKKKNATVNKPKNSKGLGSKW
jgi:hypothetical protein